MAEQAQQHPGVKTAINPAEDNRKKQCKPNETKRTSNAIHLAIDTIIIHTATQRHVARTQGFARMHPVSRRVAT